MVFFRLESIKKSLSDIINKGIYLSKDNFIISVFFQN